MSDGLHTLGRWVGDRAVGTPGRTAIDAPAGTLTYAELADRSAALADGLRAAGLRRGDLVATLTANSADHVVVFFACAQAGLVLTPLNGRLAAAELAYQLADAAPALLLTDAERVALAAEAVALAGTKPGRALLGAGGVESGVPDLGRPPASREDVRDDDPLLCVYTSGTTGRPKGALLTHANCFWTNLSLSRTAGMSGEDVVLAVLPQFHVGGWNVQPLLALWCGATVVLEPAFDPGRALELIQRHRVTTMMGVPATYLFLAEHPGFAAADLSSLSLAIVGGAPMPEALLRIWQDRGVRLAQGYGLTEAAPNVLCVPPEEAARRRGWAGKPYPHVDVALADVDTGALLDGPAYGELLVAGPNVFAGYRGRPEETASALRGGWLHTGDIAERDAEGYYRIRDRRGDMYVSGGENVYPAEVEAALHEHPAIAEAAVVGTPDARWGEVGLAVVVRRGGAELDENAVIDHCRARLAGFKVPRAVCFVDALPRSAIGKLDKSRLRSSAAEGDPA
jgi:fatty-acyl-CoA synthase